ncbi:MAG: glycosyltransferase family 4 protein [Desulfobacteraceae bacterium]|nr:glycosyltransferase family 4 protein [Desulfobacteraceae bacterium]
MSYCGYCSKEHNVGFISTRFAGTDGVSLEAEKWANIFEKEGLNCFYFAGELDRDPARQHLVEEAHFQHNDIKKITQNCFGVNKRDRATTKLIQRLSHYLKDQLYKFISKYGIDLLVAENCLTIPLNIPLGIALTELISETGINTIAHHHDFYWERQQFMVNAAWEYLNMAFPPHLPSIHHVVINTSADSQLSLRSGISSSIIPNVMDFENPPQPPADYTADVKSALGLKSHELLVLQPTRVVKRKGIEHAIEFVHRLGARAKLIISHASGDEGHSYERRVWEYSRMLDVETVFVSDIINDKRGITKDGRKIYTLNDIYPYADIVTYPSNFEGFGNAFLEAVYYSKPILVNNYSIYSTDIRPKGFSVIEIDGYVTRSAIQLAKKILRDEAFKNKMVRRNYELALRHFSYKILRHKLKALIADCLPCRLGFMPFEKI